MELFKNTVGYAPVTVNLEAHYAKPFAQLPPEVQQIVASAFDLFPWDSLGVAERRSVAAQHDYQRDPKHEPATYFELCSFQTELQDWIKKAREQGKDAVVISLRDVNDRIDQVLEVDRERVGTEIRALRAVASGIVADPAKKLSLPASDKITLRWLLDHIPLTWWLPVLGFLGGLFFAGVQSTRVATVREIFGLPAYEAPASKVTTPTPQEKP